MITDVDGSSDAGQKGIRVGDLILEIGGFRVTGPEDIANGRPGGQQAAAQGRVDAHQVRQRDALRRRPAEAGANVPLQGGANSEAVCSELDRSPRFAFPPRSRGMVRSLGSDLPANPGEPGAPMRVLVIEDDRETAQFLQRSLKENGHVADIAGDGDTGLRSLAKAAGTSSLSTACCRVSTACR